LKSLLAYRRFLFATLALLVCDPVTAACLCTYTPAKLVDVLDGGNIVFEITGEQKTIRLAGIITPRLKPNPQLQKPWCEAEGAKAIQAKAYTAELLSQASQITLDEQQVDEAGEITAVVYIDNFSLGQELLYKYLAVENNEPTQWCD
jgi:endonuclease YncB( thermonuclease family)